MGLKGFRCKHVRCNPAKTKVIAALKRSTGSPEAEQLKISKSGTDTELKHKKPKYDLHFQKAKRYHYFYFHF